MRKRSENTVLVNGYKFCPECRTTKPAADFPVRKTGKLYTYCRPCNAARTRAATARNPERRKAYNKAWYARNRESELERARKARYLRDYGIPYEAVIEKLASQNSRCAICETEIDEKTLVVDHCHRAGHVRDLLCNLCNISLAPIEREGFLEKALAYLERHRSGS